MANKTVSTNISVSDFINGLEKESDREVSRELVNLMSTISGSEAKMWGPSIIGFGEYHYQYESGREGDFFIMGFSPRKASISLYIQPGIGFFQKELAQLGQFKTGKSCLYVKRLSDINISVLKDILKSSLKFMQEKYEIKN